MRLHVCIWCIYKRVRACDETLSDVECVCRLCAIEHHHRWYIICRRAVRMVTTRGMPAQHCHHAISLLYLDPPTLMRGCLPMTLMQGSPTHDLDAGSPTHDLDVGSPTHDLDDAGVAHDTAHYLLLCIRVLANEIMLGSRPRARSLPRLVVPTRRRRTRF